MTCKFVLKSGNRCSFPEVIHGLCVVHYKKLSHRFSYEGDKFKSNIPLPDWMKNAR